LNGDSVVMSGENPQEVSAQHIAPLRFGLTALLLGNLALAFGPVFVRIATSGPAGIGPVAAAFWRIALAAPVIFLIARMAGQPAHRFPRALGWHFLFAGCLFAADLAAWHFGIMQTKLANANLLGNSTSFLLPAWAFLVARAWPSRMQGVALGLAFGGAALLMGRSYELSPANLVGDLLCVLAGAFYTAYLVMMATARSTMKPWPVLAWVTVMSVVPLLAASLALGERLLPANWTPLLLLSLFSQIVGQGLMLYAVGRVTPVLFGITLLLQPMVSALVGWYAYQEPLSTADWIGAALIGLALVIVQQPDKQADRTAGALKGS
jgi:drug/metabolite transporter (DMT)-like permease